MKSLIVCLMLIASNAFAFPTPAEMKANYSFCVASDPTWHSRFGQHVVAFDVEGAPRTCMSRCTPSRSALMGCHSESGFLYAGYYCQDLFPE